MSHHPRRRPARFGHLLAAFLVALAVVAGPWPARAQTPDDETTEERRPTGIVVDEVTPRVVPGETLRIAVRIRPPQDAAGTDPADLRVAFRFGERIRERGELQKATADGADLPDGPSFSVTPEVDADGTLRASIERRVVGVGRSDTERIVLPRPGVYPVGIALTTRASSTPLDSLVTTAIRAGDVEGEPLRFSWIWPLHVAPPATPDTGDEVLAAAVAPDGELRRAVELAGTTSLPLTLAPTPDTLARVVALAERDPDAAVVAEAFGALPRRHQILGGPYALLAADSLAALGPDALATQFAAGDRVRAEVVGAGSGRAEQLLLQERVPTAALGLLVGAGARNVVVPPTAVRAADARVPITRPFRVPDVDVRVVRADPELAADLVAAGGPVAAAQKIAADLTVVQGEATADARGLVLLQPLGVAPPGEVLAEVERRVGGTPTIAPVTLGDFTAQLPDLTSPRRRPLTVALTEPGAVPGRAASSVLARIAAATGRASLLTALTARPVPEVVAAERDLLVAPSAELIADPAGSVEWFAPAAEYVNTKLDGIRVLRQPVTLTSRTGELPITIDNESGLPLRLRVAIGSDTVQIEGPATQDVTVERRSAAVDFTVSVTSTGPFDVRYTVSPVTAGPLLESGTVQVSSTAVNGVAVFLSIGSVVFLAVWWVFSARRRRRGPAQRRPSVHVHTTVDSREMPVVPDAPAQGAVDGGDAPADAETRACGDDEPTDREPTTTGDDAAPGTGDDATSATPPVRPASPS